jgi:uncharacterized protein
MKSIDSTKNAGQSEKVHRESEQGTKFEKPKPRADWFWNRWLYFITGMLCLGLAFAGAILPVLPCTPFVLLAVYCFSRSSQRMHSWLLRSRVFGPLIADWQTHRAIRRRVRTSSILIILVVVALTFAIVQPPLWLMLVIAGLVSIGLFVILRLPVFD